MKKETYSLRDGNIAFTVDIPDISDVQEMISGLTPELQVALIENAVSQWAYRKGAKKENHGVHFGFYAAVNDMASVSERNTGPSKKDITDAEAWWKKEWSVVCASIPLPAQAKDMDDAAYAEVKKPIMADRRAKMAEVVVAKIAANNAHHKGLDFTADPEMADSDVIKHLYRAIRLHENRNRTGAV